ncbi:MAG: hypothetical protein IIA89_15415 [Chloroflexi bacterium]|nr:hypothetical protein [Chloroflexota bacterium]
MPTLADRSTFTHVLKTSCCEPAAADYIRSTWPAWMPRLAFADSLRGDVLIVIFLRGAADALNMIVPHGEQAYYVNRPTLSVPRPDDSRAARAERAIDLDGFFGLHPLLRPLKPIWDQGHSGCHPCLRGAGRISKPFQSNGADGARGRKHSGPRFWMDQSPPGDPGY